MISVREARAPNFLDVFNSIIEMEEIPPMFKSGLLSPVYKGGGKDPFLTTNYHGITVNSVLSKLLETDSVKNGESPCQGWFSTSKPIRLS